MKARNKMFGFFKDDRKRKLFEGCDFLLAKQVIISSLAGGVIPKELAQLLDNYIDNPCFNTAFELTNKYPDLMVYFEQCKPNGLYTRLGIPK
jgi:hypothetical protein